ncbi:hypothetical protein ACRARG_04745 [Pseudooceanicola sp. C21-150M6]|uniref:hypothetical protein n=1 Tax=Pseudooceanicola sp. C21-150M6 TaxID=3434355 RepID=UPI003D7F880C
MTDMPKYDPSDVSLKNSVWHYMDAETVAGYGPWVRLVDFDALPSERDALAARVERLEEALSRIKDHYTDTGLAAKHMAAIARAALQEKQG